MGTASQSVTIPGATTATGSITANGGLTTSSTINIKSTNFINFGSDVAGKESNAGQMGYQTFTSGSLDIVGAGTTVGNRHVRLHDALTTGTLTAATIYATSSIDSILYLGSVKAQFGYIGKAGTGGNYSNVINWNWTGTSLQGWVDNTNVATLCDYRIKENIKPALPVLDRLCSIKMFDYTHKNISICKNNGNHIGLYAHELQEIFNEYPCLVRGEKDEEHEDGEIKIQSIEMPILNMILMKSIKEQNDIIKSQQKQIDLLTLYWTDFIATHTT